MALSIIFVLSSCQNDDIADNQNVSEFISALPENVTYPESNPYSKEKEDLGRLLYWDPIMSGNKDIACVSCHHPNLGYADGLSFSQGVGGQGLGKDRVNGVEVRRNAPTVINTAFNGINNNQQVDPELAPMFWDNRTESLEQQALLPMLSKEEMRGESIVEDAIVDTIIQRLNSIPEYVSQFEKAFGSNEINQENILAAIATFERGIVANNSRFDQYMRGDLTVLTDLEIDGMNAFIQVGCADCHGGPMFSDYKLHIIGVKDNITPVDRGATNKFDFRTPTLRNLNLTAPYMHNGIHTTLEDVMNFYESISDGDDDELNENLTLHKLDKEMKNLELDDDDITSIIAFMNTLNDDNFDKTIPNSVPSGLPVGGNINQ
ncbi:MAG: cytochrome C peroxidase [Cytophagales bacterium]|nr:cytochrome C peroxidase [Cytophagales bacterium]